MAAQPTETSAPGVPTTTPPAPTVPAATTTTTANLPTTPATSDVPVVPNPTPEPTSDTPDPSQTGTPKTKNPTRTTSRVTSSATGPATGTATLPGGGGGNGPDQKDGGSGKSILAPVVGGIAGALVLAFLVAVFVMRHRKKNKARKRRLEFLDDHNAGPITSGATTGGAGGAAGSHRPDSLSSPLPPRPATPIGRSSGPGGRPLEMAAIGGAGAAAAHHHHKQQQQQHQADGYDYQQGYQQVPYGGYPDPAQQQPYDQYDPYYAQRQQQQAQEYYADQQQGYYPEAHSYQQQNQFTPEAPVRGSPAMTQNTVASNLAYPPPPPSTTTGGHSSPRTTPLQQSAVPVPAQGSFEKGAPYANSSSAARNPQVITEDDVKVPM
ncbi:hypothetical protein KI688_007797 [Linnemannia hyalina]|uniref:Uncharacterized protein n=1 Tax=Linnemannia hyalina TaxID=64524 RepID=A0A9P8BME1_9FUNG|nr:hypothetical protein KI688_007797 [Linnemannia hyalina]